MDLSMNVEELQRAISGLMPIPGKLSLSQGTGDALLISDVSNTSLQGMLNLIRTLSMYKTTYETKLILVTRGIIELGLEKQQSYQQILQALYGISATLYTTDSLFKKLGTQNDVHYFGDEKAMTAQLVQIANKNAVIALSGRLHPNSLKSIIIDVPANS
jgi:UDP-N-acetylmuramyl pentapeptide synthase